MFNEPSKFTYFNSIVIIITYVLFSALVPYEYVFRQMASVMNTACRRQLSAICRASLNQTRVPLFTVQKRHLPVCAVDTNLSKVEVPKDFNAKLSKVVATMLNKPEKVIYTMLYMKGAA